MKRNSIIFIFLFAFFIVVAIGALIMLNGSNSIFYRDAKYIGAQTAVMSQTVVGDEPVEEVSVPEEPVVEASVEEASVEASVEEASVEAATEASSEEAETREKRYFTFVTSTQYTVLRLREAPSEDAKILHRLNKKTPGYILQPGNTWSKVVLNSGAVGYCATEYLKMTEVTKEDYPEDYAEMVEAPEEDLTY